MDTVRSSAATGRILTTLVVLAGPVLTVAFVLANIGSEWIRADQASLILKVALLAWSPLFFSIPALLTQDGRDEALPQLDGLLGSMIRGVILVPWLVLSPRSTVRTETTASLIGFALAASLAWSHLAW